VTPAELAARRSLYAVDAADLLKPLPEVGESLAAQLCELVRCPTPERAERLAMELEGVKRLIARVREKMLQEAAPERAPTR
jgi:hypothetical protein